MRVSRSRDALLQARGGTARHDAVAWGYARAASGRGVDIIQNCEVTGFLRDGSGAVVGIETTRGPIRAGKVGIAVAGNSSRLAAMAGIQLPIESHVLQAFVSEGLKPVLPTVVTYGAAHFYISQSDKGGLVFGGDIDGYNSYAMRGNLPIVEDVCEAAMALVPMIGRARLLRSWGGLMDMSMDGSPIIDHSQVEGLYINAGWCYGGFKATPASGWCSRICWRRIGRTKWRRHIGSIGLLPATFSMRRDRARSPTCTEDIRNAYSLPVLR